MATTRYRWLIAAAILLLTVAVLTIGLIASGVFDPAPAGALLWRSAEQQISVAPQSREIIWLEEAVPDSAITARVTGALNNGAEDSGYGLVFGNEEAYLAVAVSPTGYLGIWESNHQAAAIRNDYLLQWQTWPHVQSGQSPNEIWVDINDDRATVRINREWLWEGEVNGSIGGIGLLGESFADSAIFDFSGMELFAASDK